MHFPWAHARYGTTAGSHRSASEQASPYFLLATTQVGPPEAKWSQSAPTTQKQAPPGVLAGQLGPPHGWPTWAFPFWHLPLLQRPLSHSTQSALHEAPAGA